MMPRNSCEGWACGNTDDMVQRILTFLSFIFCGINNELQALQELFRFF